MPPVKEVLGQLPPGYVAVPLLAEQEAAPLRLCLVFRRERDPVAGHWVVLRHTMDARVLLGCISDAGGQTHQYLEIWIQDVSGIDATVAARREVMNNRILDERWARHHAALLASQATQAFTTGWESRHPLPTVLDPATLEARHLSSAQGEWSLCQDDAILTTAGLSAYSTSLDRYLYQPARGSETRFVAVTPTAATNDRALPLESLIGPAGVVPVNPAGGLLLVREFAPFAYEEYLQMLRTGALEGAGNGKSILPLIGSLSGNGDASDHGHPSDLMLLSRSGRTGWLIETLYLRLRALAGAVNAVREVVRHTARPILNLTADSFDVALSPASPGLPLLWTSRVWLRDPGDAVALSIPGVQEQIYVRGSLASPTIYRPDVADASQGRGTFRIRQVLPEARGVVLEGTFKPREPLAAARNDLLRVRIAVAAGRVDLYTRLQPEAALAGGEWRLRTVPQSLPPEVVTQLQAAQGVAFPAEFEHIPVLSTPCDLYALGVLAVQTVLKSQDTPLAVALDEAYSLARQVAIEHDASVPLANRIASIFTADPRWSKSIGPHVLSSDPLVLDAAMPLPSEVWWDLLACVVRMFPGVGPDSASADYGDAPPNAIHRTFDRTAEDLDALMGKVRALIVGDTRFNREVQGVIQRFLAPAAGKPKPPENARAPVR